MKSHIPMQGGAGFTDHTSGGCPAFYWFRDHSNQRWLVINGIGNFAAVHFAHATTDDFGNLVRVPA